MAERSAGLMMFSYKDSELKIFLVHPGGPYFTKKDYGHWSIPKGLIEKGEDIQKAAIREFEEETGMKPSGKLIPLGEVVLKSGKIVYAWAFNLNDSVVPEFKSNLFEMEWPPKSGKRQSFPEADKFGFFSVDEARKKINSSQLPLIDKLLEYLNNNITNNK